MDLFIYPQAANYDNGYGIGIEYAYKKIPPQKDDIVIWYTSYDKFHMNHVRESDYIIERKGIYSYRSLSNILSGRIRSELIEADLKFLKKYEFANIHCDEVIFYRALRKLFPNKKINIRFHNCYSRIWARNLFLKRKIGFKYNILLKNMVSLECEIFKDQNVHKIFVSNEDRDFYMSTFGVSSDSETWQYSPDIEMMNRKREPIHVGNKLVWFGGCDSHKESSIRWFTDDIFPQIRNKQPSVEFHLWGGGTMRFNNPQNGIYAHGFYEGSDFPIKNALYVNPDIIGGGIKLKLLTLMDNGIPFISTPFGFEGYEKCMIDNIYCNVVEENKWPNAVVDFLNKYKESE